MTHERYIVCGNRPWIRPIFTEAIDSLPGEWVYVDCPKELEKALEREPDPRYVFFLHWSWIVPKSITDRYECVCFHMTDVPYGRGGSPLQNLIERGHRETVLTALRMVRDLDAGPVYMKDSLSLAGTAEEVYLRATRVAVSMIRRIVHSQPSPTPQVGEPVVFNRRAPDQSRLPEVETLDDLYDFIRMLDAEGYPHAFLRHGRFVLEFRRAALYADRVQADVIFRPTES